MTSWKKLEGGGSMILRGIEVIRVLETLREGGGMTFTELVYATRIPPKELASLLRDLQGKGLVEKDEYLYVFTRRDE